MTVRSNSVPAVVLGLSPTGLAVARALGKHDVSVYAAYGSRLPVGRFSRYCRRLDEASKASRRKDAGAMRRHLVRLAESCGTRPVLYITDDPHIELLHGEYDALSDSYLLSTDYRACGLSILDKRSFYALCDRHDVEVPATYWPGSDEDLERIAASVRYPALIKPALPHHFYRSIGPSKVVTATTASELTRVYHEYSRVPGDLVIQEIVPGGDDRIWICVVYLDRRSVPLATFVGRKLRQYPPHFGSASLAESRWNEEVAAISESFLRALGYRGIASLEFKQDPRDGAYRMIEVNARMILPGSLCAGAGVDIVRTAYLDLVGEDVPHWRQRDGVRWVFVGQDLRSAVRMWKTGELRPGEWFRSIRDARHEAVFDWRDPGPALYLPFYPLVQKFVRGWE